MNNYFISREAEIIFYLVELEGETRLKKLGINRTHYSNKNKATKWRNDLAKLIHPDKCDHPEAVKAFTILEKMYHEMID